MAKITTLVRLVTSAATLLGQALASPGSSRQAADKRHKEKLVSAIDLRAQAIDIPHIQTWTDMKITYYGHACFGAEIGSKNLLFDPFISGNELARNIDIKKVPADYILISHGHQDHIGDAPEIAKRTGATIISNYEIAVWFNKQGYDKTHPLNHGGGYRFEFGRVRLVNALHSSSLPDGTYGGNPGGFVVESDHGNFYYSGDTALTMDMKLIGESTSLTFAALCLGDNFTMGVDDALKAADFVNCSEVLGLHYNTFPPIQIDKGAAVQKFKAAGKHLRLLKPGESTFY